jgi:hypothetical protein
MSPISPVAQDVALIVERTGPFTGATVATLPLSAGLADRRSIRIRCA